jgi:hypothetical protein
MLLFLAGLIAAQPGIRPNAILRWPIPLLKQVRATLAALPHRPAVVLFRYFPGNGLLEDPVYNTDVAWPDDAPVIRAQDLGARNVEIVRYYARRQPDRYFYLYDLQTMTLHPQGRASEVLPRLLARQQGASTRPSNVN